MKKIAVIAVTLLALSGCAKHTKDVAHPGNGDGAGAQAANAQSQRRAVDKAVEDNQGGGLEFSAEVQRLCPGIKPPHFGFDSAQLRDEWRDALGKLAECMKTGGLAGKGVLLTGHTDPRGDDAYNMALGGRRAESVKSAIETFGISADRLDTTSRGEVDAVGSDEESWARDRRVDIDVRPANGVSSR